MNAFSHSFGWEDKILAQFWLTHERQGRQKISLFSHFRMETNDPYTIWLEWPYSERVGASEDESIQSRFRMRREIPYKTLGKGALFFKGRGVLVDCPCAR